MPGLDPTIVQHHLPILPHARPVKQKLRRLHPRWSFVGFLSVVEYPEWLANVVPVPKNGKVRVSILDMPTPRTEKEIRGFLGRLQYISRFIARLTDICEPIFRLLRKNQPTVWNDDYALDLGIRQLEIHGDSNLVIKQTQGIWRTRDEKLKPYHAYLDLLIDRFDVLRYIHLPRAENQFADALATLASLIVIPAGVNVRPLLIETRSAPAYYCLIGEIEDQIELPWYHDIYQFLSCGAYPESASAKDRRALRQLATRFVVCGDALYRRSPDGLLLLCLDRASADRVMREVHAGVCGPHMGGHMLALWGIDIIGKISPKSSSGHEYILVAIDYFTKWVEAASYARLTAARVAKFIDLILSRRRVPHELISDRGVHFKGEVDTLTQEYEKLPFALWAYRTSFRTSIGATPYSLVYGMEAVLPVEIEMRSLRVALEQHISEAEWAQSRYDQLSLLDEKRLRAADHVQAYQRKMTRAFRKRVKPRKFQRGDLVLKVLRGLISDPRGKFKPSWSGPYVIRDRLEKELLVDDLGEISS
ncbi:hypothetical protein AAG906_013148 [Vitis piasezkii]